MIRALILYFLDVKESHGYEIQKFIQLSHLDEWTKIQSGSIYHALEKLEEEGAINRVRTEREGRRARHVWTITDKGRRTLAEELRLELSRNLWENGSDKFLLYACLDRLETDDIRRLVEEHLKSLSERVAWLEHWRRVKNGDFVTRLEKLSFSLMIRSVKDQIRWHQVLMEDIEVCKEMGRMHSAMIKAIDFSGATEESISSLMENHK